MRTVNHNLNFLSPYLRSGNKNKSKGSTGEATTFRGEPRIQKTKKEETLMFLSSNMYIKMVRSTKITFGFGYQEDINAFFLLKIYVYKEIIFI